jgi:diguanylate cyclase (GGDEF)-like protein
MTDVRILLVDDEEFYRKLFSDILSSRKYDIQTAENGEQALAQLKKDKFDILITDLVMGEVDGLVLAEEVRGSYPWMEVIVVTQQDDVRLAVRSMQMGVFEYLVKPVDRDELLLTIDRLLERRRLLEQQNKLLDESMRYLQAQTVYRRCLEILSTLDFENLVEMILRHMLQATGTQGGLLWLTSPEERPGLEGVEKLNLAGYRGLVSLDDFPAVLTIKEKHLLGQNGTGAPFFSKPSDVLELNRSLVDRDALFIPLLVDDVPVGLMVLLDKLREDFSDRDQNIARTMAEFSAIAIKNSRRFQALERVGLKDQSSTAYNLTYFIDYAGKEIYKARRYIRDFSLVTVVIDRYESLQEHFKAKVCQQISRKLVESISRIVRDSDILAKVSDFEYYLLLPETDALGARMFIRRSRETFDDDSVIKKISGDYPVSISFGSSTFPLDGEDFDQLLGVCRDRVEKSRSSLLRRLGLAGKSFWEAIEALAGKPEEYTDELEEASQSYRMSEDIDAGSCHGVFSEELFSRIENEVSLQAVGDPNCRAIVYALGDEIGREPRPCEKIVSQSQRSKAFILGRRGQGAKVANHPAVTRVFLDDEEMAKYRVFLVFGERVAYAFIGIKNDQAEWFAFHSHDSFLVESLIAKLQEYYHFQRQY